MFIWDSLEVLKFLSYGHLVKRLKIAYIHKKTCFNFTVFAAFSLQLHFQFFYIIILNTYLTWKI